MKTLILGVLMMAILSLIASSPGLALPSVAGVGAGLRSMLPSMALGPSISLAEAESVAAGVSVEAAVVDPLPGLTEGRIVHFVLENGDHRPAIVVRVWNPKATDVFSRGYINLQVFTDGENDGLQNVEWRTSVAYSEDKTPRTWHWIEKA